MLLFDPEIERSLRELPRFCRDQNTMNQQLSERRMLADFVMPTMANESGGIVIPEIANQHFELKPAVMQMVQNKSYHGMPGEDPYAHLSSFNNVCQTFKMQGVTNDAVRLLLFPFSLKDRHNFGWRVYHAILSLRGRV